MEFEVKGQTYKIEQLDALTQFHVVRRLAPVLGKIIPALNEARAGTDLSFFETLSMAVSEMTDEDANYCIFTLLKRVKRKQAQGLGWAAVTAGNQQIMFSDIDITVMLQIVAKAIQFNFSDFFSESPLASNNEAPAQNNPLNG